MTSQEWMIYYTEKIEEAVQLSDELEGIIAGLEESMHAAAANLEFEKAAAFRDQIFELRKILALESNLKPWEKIRLLAGDR